MTTYGSANHGRRGRPWRRLRAEILAAHPACSVPGCRRPANQVDHVVPLSVRPDLAHVRSNLRAVCSVCNQRKGARLSRRPVYLEPTEVTCRFHVACGSVHSEPWCLPCRGTGTAELCVAACGTAERWQWCAKDRQP